MAIDLMEELLTRGVEKIYPSREALEKVLRSGKKIRLYLGIDPTGEKLHIGHTVALWKLRQFQELGQHTILLIGDFTAMIGDPTGKIVGARKLLSREEVLRNAETYKQQVSNILLFTEPNPIEIRFNSEWLAKMNAIEFLRLSNYVSYQQIIERDMFQQRMKEGKDIMANEFMYPLLQGYDSVVLDVDLELGGNDQLFNMMVGRDLMKKIKKKEKFVMTVPLLTDAAGRKIGKTEGNVIGITDPPNELFGKIMSLPDDIIVKGFELLTRIPMEEVQTIKKQLEDESFNPIDLKKRLAHTLVAQFHSAKDADNAQVYFEKTVQQKELPKENVTIFEVALGTTIAGTALANNLASSMSELKRLVDQGGIYHNNNPLTRDGMSANVADGDYIRRGTHEIIKVRIT